jgi:hypothetical protein
MGKKAKEHRKKVVARNQKIKADQKKAQKMYQDMFTKMMEEQQQKMQSELGVDVNGQSIPFEVVSESQTPTV